MYKHIRWAVLGILPTVAVGIAGLMATEHLSAWQAFYLTAETLNTVGFGDLEVHTWGGQFILLLLMFGGIGFSDYFDNKMMAFVIGERQGDPAFFAFMDNVYCRSF